MVKLRLPVSKNQVGPQTIAQLRAEPSVIVPRCNDRVEKLDRNAPDLLDIGCYIECSTAVDDSNVYSSNYTKSTKSSDEVENRHLDSNLFDVEKKLQRLFEEDNSSTSTKAFENKSTASIDSKKTKSKKSSKSKQESVETLLIELFGSNLEDLNVSSPKPKKLDIRRHTLPVSISIHNDILKPLKVKKKRKSENDIELFCKIRRVEFPNPVIPRTVDITYQLASEFFCEKIKYHSAVMTTVPNYSCWARSTVLKVYEKNTTEIMHAPSETIDLTDDDNGLMIDLPADFYQEQVKEESSESVAERNPSSEKPQANTLSMPLLSPQRVAASILMEAKAQASSNQKSASMPESHDENIVSRVPAECAAPPPQRPRLKCQKTPTVKSTVKERRSAQKNPKQTINNHLRQQHNQQIEQHYQQPQQKQINAAHLLQGHATPYNRQTILPELLRISQPSVELISNVVFAEKLYLHLLIFAQWRFAAIEFCQKLKLFMPAHDFNQNSERFTEYYTHMVVGRGRNLLIELRKYEVSGFHFRQVCDLTQRKLEEKKIHCNRVTVPFLLFVLMEYCYDYCTTPFTKKFYDVVKLTVKAMESRCQQVKPNLQFSLSQRQQLQSQIQQYILINNWLHCNSNRNTTGTQPLRIVPPQRTQQTVPTSKETPLSHRKTTVSNTLSRTWHPPTEKGNNTFATSQSGNVASRFNNVRPGTLQPGYTRMQPYQSLQQGLNGTFNNIRQHYMNAYTSSLERKERGHSSNGGQFSTGTPDCPPTSAFNSSVGRPPLAASGVLQNYLQRNAANSSATSRRLADGNEDFLNSTANSGQAREATQVDQTHNHLPPPSYESSVTCPNVNVALALPPTASNNNIRVEQHPKDAQGYAQQTNVPDTNTPTVPKTGLETASSRTVFDTSSGEGKDEDVIDLTWMDDEDMNVISEEILDFKAFPFKVEEKVSEDEERNAVMTREESISPTDSGLGSPLGQQVDATDTYKCLCGNLAIFICKCKTSMYCSQGCQRIDWEYHQRLCNNSIT